MNSTCDTNTSFGKYKDFSYMESISKTAYGTSKSIFNKRYATKIASYPAVSRYFSGQHLYKTSYYSGEPSILFYKAAKILMLINQNDK
jgi:hypothetical protein